MCSVTTLDTLRLLFICTCESVQKILRMWFPHDLLWSFQSEYEKCLWFQENSNWAYLKCFCKFDSKKNLCTFDFIFNLRNSYYPETYSFIRPEKLVGQKFQPSTIQNFNSSLFHAPNSDFNLSKPRAVMKLILEGPNIHRPSFLADWCTKWLS